MKTYNFKNLQCRETALFLFYLQQKMQKLRKKKLNTLPNSFPNYTEDLHKCNLFPVQEEKFMNIKSLRPQSNTCIVTKGFPNRRTTTKKSKITIDDYKQKIQIKNQNLKERSQRMQSKYINGQFQKHSQQLSLKQKRSYNRYSPSNRCKKLITFNGGFRNLTKYSRKFVKSSHQKIGSQQDLNLKSLNIEGVKFMAPTQCENFDNCFLKNSFITSEIQYFNFRGLKEKRQFTNPNTQFINTPTQKEENIMQIDIKIGANLCINSVHIDKISFGKQNYSLHVGNSNNQKIKKQNQRKKIKEQFICKNKSNKQFISKCQISQIHCQKVSRPQSCYPLSFSNFVGTTK